MSMIPPKIDLRAKARKDYLPLEMDGSVAKFAEQRINRVMIFISKDMFTPSNVSVSLDDDPRVIKLFDFEPKEISFSNAELVGLTAKEAKELYHKKDIAWLQSP